MNTVEQLIEKRFGKVWNPNKYSVNQVKSLMEDYSNQQNQHLVEALEKIKSTIDFKYPNNEPLSGPISTIWQIAEQALNTKK